MNKKRLVLYIVASVQLLAANAWGHSGQVAVVQPLRDIVVDGDLSDWPAPWMRWPIRFAEFGDAPRDTADLRADLRMGYDERAQVLYLAVHVVDESVVVDTSAASAWDTGDGCDIYIDLGHGAGKPVAQYGMYGTALRIGKSEMVEWGARRGAGEHSYEWRVDMSQVVADWSAGAVLGLDVAVMDRDADGSYSWVSWGRGVRKFESPDRLGDAVLAADDIGQLEGVLAWADTKEPVAHELVRIRSERAALVLETDGEGNFNMPLPAGRYEIDKPGEKDAAVSLRVESGDTAVVQLDVSPSLGVAVAAGAGTIVRQPQGGREGPLHYFSAADGLPHRVAALLQDDQRNLWIGTWHGVCRYDGRDFLVLDESDGLVSNSVDVLIEDSAGRLWFGTRAGLSRYDGERFVNFATGDGLASDRINALLEGEDGAIWIGTQRGLNRYDGHRFTTFTQESGLANNIVRALLRTRDGLLWVATEGGVSRYDGHSFATPNELRGLQVYALAEDAEGNLWVATRDGVLCYDGADTVLYGAEDGVPTIERMEVLGGDLMVDSGGGVWVGNQGGVARFADGAWTEPLVNPGDSHSPFVRALLEDGEGNIWVGTQSGLSRYDAQSFSYLSAESGLRADRVLSMLQSQSGDIWIGTAGYGLYRYNLAGRIAAAGPQWLGEKNVFSLYEDAIGALWVGWQDPRSGGVLRCINGDCRALEDLPDALKTQIASIAEDGEGAMWFGAHSGLYRLADGIFTRYAIEDGLPDNYVWQLLVARDGRLWVATDRGLCYWDGARFVSFPERPEVGAQMVDALAEDRQGRVWVGTERGLYYYENDSFTALAQSEGFGASHVSALLVDRDGVLWLGTSEGVGRYDGRVMQTLLHRDGLLSNPTHVLMQDREGYVWLATGQGITRYLPRHIPPVLEIQDIVADQRYGSVQEVELEAPLPLLAFEFHARSFKTRHGGMVYRYRLEGREGEWRTTRLPRVEYRGLPVGDYAFVAEAVDRDLTYSAPVRIRISVRPPYRQIALYSLLGLCVVLIAGGSLHVVRSNRHLQVRVEERTAELEQAKDEAEVAQAEAEVAQAEAERSQAEAEAANSAKSLFLANMSHEIRTPMNAIMGFTQLLGDRIDGAQERRYLQSIRSSGSALLRLIEDILDMSRIEAGKIEVQYAAVDLRRLLEEVEEIFIHRVEEKGLRFVVDVDAQIPAALRLDEGKLRQVLLNLVGNALKFTEAGQIRIAAELHPASGGAAELVLVVEDTGIGIPLEERELLWLPFTQRSGQDHARYGGAGLGLSISRRLIEVMGGRIELESEAGRGSAFRVLLPAESMLVPAQREAAGKSEVESVRFVGARVLVADDDASNRELLQAYLAAAGVEVVQAENGRRCLELARELHPDLILLDVKMPVMSGIETMNELRKEEDLRSIPIAFVTASALREEREDLQRTAVTVLMKPIDRDVLFEVLGRYLQREGAAAVATVSAEVGAALAPELVAALDGELRVAWQRAQQTQIVNHAETFAQQLRDGGARYACPELVAVGDELLEHCATFAVEKIRDVLRDFPALVQALKER